MTMTKLRHSVLEYEIFTKWVLDEKLKKKDRKDPPQAQNLFGRLLVIQSIYRITSDHSIEAFERLYIQVIWKIVENLSNGGYLPLDLEWGVIKDFVPCLNY